MTENSDASSKNLKSELKKEITTPSKRWKISKSVEVVRRDRRRTLHLMHGCFRGLGLHEPVHSNDESLGYRVVLFVWSFLRLAVLVEHRLVTDRRTDRHRAVASTADA